jgi:hypothetical protein
VGAYETSIGAQRFHPLHPADRPKRHDWAAKRTQRPKKWALHGISGIVESARDARGGRAPLLGRDLVSLSPAHISPGTASRSIEESASRRAIRAGSYRLAEITPGTASRSIEESASRGEVRGVVVQLSDACRHAASVALAHRGGRTVVVCKTSEIKAWQRAHAMAVAMARGFPRRGSTPTGGRCSPASANLEKREFADC